MLPKSLDLNKSMYRDELKSIKNLNFCLSSLHLIQLRDGIFEVFIYVLRIWAWNIREFDWLDVSFVDPMGSATTRNAVENLVPPYTMCVAKNVAGGSEVGRDKGRPERVKSPYDVKNYG